MVFIDLAGGGDIQFRNRYLSRSPLVEDPQRFSHDRIILNKFCLPVLKDEGRWQRQHGLDLLLS